MFSIQNQYDIETPTIRPMYIYPGGPFSKNDRCNVFPENPNLIMWNNAKLWGVPLAPPFPKYPCASLSLNCISGNSLFSN